MTAAAVQAGAAPVCAASGRRYWTALCGRCSRSLNFCFGSYSFSFTTFNRSTFIGSRSFWFSRISFCFCSSGFFFSFVLFLAFAFV